jgi:hypothetical protein
MKMKKETLKNKNFDIKLHYFSYFYIKSILFEHQKIIGI